VVNVLATSATSRVRLCDLTKDDFLLDEDGHPQTISYFSREIDLPLTLGLLVDTSGSERRMIPDERRAASAFSRQGDAAGQGPGVRDPFRLRVELLVDLTNSREKLEKALNQWIRRNCSASSRAEAAIILIPAAVIPARQGGQGGQRQRGGGTDFTTPSIWRRRRHAHEESRKRKALILLSDGVDTGSKETLGSAIEAAQRPIPWSTRFYSKTPTAMKQ